MNKKDEAMKVLQPGCDRLTDPSEIAALGKYLRKKKQDHEDSIVLGGDPTKKAASELKNDMTSLGGSVERLNTRKIHGLEKDAAHKIIGGSGEISSLGNQRVEAEGTKDNTNNKLSGDLEKLEGSIKLGNLTEEVERLRKDNEEISLSKKLQELGIKEKQNFLDDSKEHIIGKNDIKDLPEELQRLGERKVNELKKNIEKLNKEDDNISLSKNTQDLRVEDKINLEGNIEKLKDNKKDISLSDQLLAKVGENKDISLDSSKEKISGENNSINLTEEVERLRKDNEEISLSKKLQELGIKEKTESLPTTRENLEDNRDTHLDGKVEKLDHKTDRLSLSDRREELEIEKKETILGTSKEIITGIDSINELERNIEKIKDDKEQVSLGDNVLVMEGERKDTSLSSIKENINGDDENIDSLKSEAEKMKKDTKNISLSSESVKLKITNKENSLESSQEIIIGDTKVPDLSDEIERLKVVDEKPILPTSTEKIKIGETPSLSKERTPIPGEEKEVVVEKTAREGVIHKMWGVEIIDPTPDGLGTTNEKVQGDKKEPDLTSILERIGETNEITELTGEIERLNHEDGFYKLPEVEVEKLENQKELEKLEGEASPIFGTPQQDTTLSPLTEKIQGEGKKIEELNPSIELLEIKDNPISLEDESEKVQGEKKDVKIEGEAEKIGDVKNIEFLGTKESEKVGGEEKEILHLTDKLSETLDSQEKVTSLSGKAITIDIRGNEIENLPSESIDVIGNSEGTPELEISKEKVIGSERDIHSLEENTEKVQGEKKDVKVEGNAEKIPNIPEESLILETTHEKVNQGEGGLEDIEFLSGSSSSIIGSKKEVEGLEGNADRIYGQENSISELSGDSIKVDGEQKDTPTLSKELKEKLINNIEPTLEGSAEKINNTPKEVDRLGGEAEKKIGDSLEVTLNDSIENIEGNLKEVPALSTELSDKLQDNRKVELEKGVEERPGNDIEVNLGNPLEHVIGDTIDPSLSDHQEKVGEVDEVESLGNHRENLEDLRETELSDHKETLTDVTEVESLSEYKESLTDIEEIEGLSSHKESLTDIEEVKSLSEHREDLKDIENPDSLSNHLEKTEGVEETKELSSVRQDLTNIEEVENLSDHKENLEGVKDPDSLSDYIETLEDLRENKLSDYLEKGPVEQEVSLEDKRLDLKTEEVENLSDHRENLEDLRENKLSDYIEKGPERKEIPLGEERLDLDVEEVVSLSDFLDTLDWEDDPKLSEHRENLEDLRETELSNVLIKEIKEKDVDLDETRLDLKVEEVESLSDTREDLEDLRETELSDYREKTKKNDTTKINVGRVSDYENSKYTVGGTYTGTPWEKDTSDNYNHEGFSTLGKTKVRVQPEDEKVNIGKGLIGDGSPGGDDYVHEGWNENLDEREVERERDWNEESFNPDEDKLYEETYSPEVREKINVGKNLIEDGPGGDDYVHEGWNENLDERDPIKTETSESGNVEELSEDEPLEIIKSSKINAGGDLIEGTGDDYDTVIDELVEILKSRKDLTLYYNNILKFAQRKDLSKGWASKVSALMSSYLSGDEENEKRLKTFETQLFKTIFTEYQKELPLVDKDTDVKISTYDKDKFTGKGWEKDEDNEITGLGKTQATIDKGGVKDIVLRNDSAYVTKYKLNWAWQNVLDVSQYLRWTAEQATFGTHGSARALLLDTTLMTLVAARNAGERAAGSNRDRLPGGNNVLGNAIGMTQGNLVENAKAAARKIAKAGIKALTKDPNQLVDKTYPLNRPSDIWEKTEAFQSGNNRKSISNENEGSNLLKDVGKAIAGEVKGIVGIGGERDYTFKDHYINSTAMGITLSELCGEKNISSVEDLKIAIESSPVMTSASKVTTSSFNAKNGKVTTLDDNSNWEIVFGPYLGESNGRVSYLPSIREINNINKKQFGLDTAYGLWIPFTSFELNKSKMISKTIQLFDGEISYPVGMEYSNELRLTIADDQYKSWRRYFEMCANCAIYNSTLHKPNYYSELDNLSFDFFLQGGDEFKGGNDIETKIDKTFICPAPYKNITFRCIIYCMTPQKETIDKYDLLLVMKDFSEDRSGDIEPGGSDLTISFSIVGEHPTKKGISNFGYTKYKVSKTFIDVQAEAEKLADKAALALSIVQAGLGSATGGALDMI